MRNLMWATCDNPNCDVHFQTNKMFVINPRRNKFCSKKCRRKTINDKQREKVTRSYVSILTKMSTHDLPQEFIEAKRAALMLKRQCWSLQTKIPK